MHMHTHTVQKQHIQSRERTCTVHTNGDEGKIHSYILVRRELVPHSLKSTHRISVGNTQHGHQQCSWDRKTRKGTARRLETCSSLARETHPGEPG